MALRQITIDLGVWTSGKNAGKPIRVQLTALPVKDARPLLARLIARAPSTLPATAALPPGLSADERKAAAGEALFGAGLAYAIQTTQALAGELDALCAVFGPCSLVVDTAQTLSSENVQDELFGGHLDLMLVWLAECLTLNFGSLGGLLPPKAGEFLTAAKAVWTGANTAS